MRTRHRRWSWLRPRAERGAVLRRGAQRLGLVLAGVVLLCGCLGDLPPDPEVQSLEIVVGNADPEHEPCLLHVEEVGAGTHEVIPVSMGGSATVRIVDPSGAVLYERAVEEHRLEGGGHEVPQEDQGSVRLASGDHRVECVLSSGTHAVELLVVPARPGYEGRTG